MSTSIKQVVVPFTTVPEHLLKGKLEGGAKPHRWNPIIDSKGVIVGFHAPNYGAVVRSAYVMAEVDNRTGSIIKIVEFQFDQMVRKDGPIDDPLGHATPNAMAVVIEEREDGYWVHGTKEIRPVIFDHATGRQGVEITGITGGWAKAVGSKPEETALAELSAEAGFEIYEASVELIGSHSSNRAYEETLIEVYLAVYRGVGKRKPDGSHENIVGEVAFRIDLFKPGKDALVNSAMQMAQHHLGCVSAKSGVKPNAREIADLKEEIFKLEERLKNPRDQQNLTESTKKALKKTFHWFGDLSGVSKFLKWYNE